MIVRAATKASDTQIRIRFFARVVGTPSGPHTPTFGCTRNGVRPLRLRFENTATPTL